MKSLRAESSVRTTSHRPSWEKTMSLMGSVGPASCRGLKLGSRDRRSHAISLPWSYAVTRVVSSGETAESSSSGSSCSTPTRAVSPRCPTA